MANDVKGRITRIVADLRALANQLTDAGNPADAIRLQGYAATVRQLESELLAAELARRDEQETKLAG